MHQTVQLLLEHARPEILKEFAPDSCIASTAIGIEVLTQLFIAANPLPVRTLIFNKAFSDRIQNGAKFPKNQEQVRKWSKEDGSYSIGIGVGTGLPGKWPGHLVILVEDVLIDLSIDQANRPQYSIDLRPFAVTVGEEFLVKKEPFVFAKNGCTIRIDHLQPPNQDFLKSPDWLLSGRRKPIVDRILKIMRGKLQ